MRSWLFALVGCTRESQTRMRLWGTATGDCTPLCFIHALGKSINGLLMHDPRFAQNFNTIEYDVTVMRSVSRKTGQVSSSVESDADQHGLVLTFHHPSPSTRFTAISNRIGNDATSPGVKEFGILDDMGLPKSLFDMNSAANHTTMGSFAFEAVPLASNFDRSHTWI